MSPRIGSLCSGYGGLDLAVESVLGAQLAWYAQYEPPGAKGRPDRNQYAARIMAHHWPGVPNHGDITTIDYARVEPVDVLAAGFPCQPVSNAGHRKGQDDARWLWPHVARAVRDLRPRLVLLENVAALVGRGLDAILTDLAALRFDAEWITLPASDIGAPHERERVFILAWPAAHPGRDPRPQDHPHRPAAGRCGDPAPDAPRLAEREPADEPHPLAGGRDARPEPRGRSLPDRERERVRARDQAVTDAQDDGRERTGRPRGRRRGPAHRDPEPDWGPYTAAVRHWEHLMGRPAPAPTEPGRNGPVLAPALAEWMMGLPAGWVTAVPGVPRSAQLKAPGNGVVPQQAAYALRLLLNAAGIPTAAAAA